MSGDAAPPGCADTARSPAATESPRRPTGTTGPGIRNTRTTAPITTPGTVPASTTAVNGLRNEACRRNRASEPGIAMMLCSRLVGVTAGLGSCNTLIRIGIRKTAPETPTGVVTVANAKPADRLTASSSKVLTAAPAPHERFGIAKTY